MEFLTNARPMTSPPLFSNYGIQKMFKPHLLTTRYMVIISKQGLVRDGQDHTLITTNYNFLDDLFLSCGFFHSKPSSVLLLKASVNSPGAGWKSWSRNLSVGSGI